MKKDKNKIYYQIIMTTLIAGTIWILLMGLCNKLNEPRYNMTQEVCHNEQKIIGERIIKFNTYSCNYTLSYKLSYQQGDYYGSPKCINYTEFISGCGKDALECKITEGGLWLEYKKMDSSHPPTLTEKVKENILKNETVCKQQEVDRIDMNCYSNGSYKKNPENCPTLFISKEGLTKNWLEENCLCKEVLKEYNLFSGNKITITHCGKGVEYICKDLINTEDYSCSQYKCGNYIVEVLR